MHTRGENHHTLCTSTHTYDTYHRCEIHKGPAEQGCGTSKVGRGVSRDGQMRRTVVVAADEHGGGLGRPRCCRPAPAAALARCGAALPPTLPAASRPMRQLGGSGGGDGGDDGSGGRGWRE